MLDDDEGDAEAVDFAHELHRALDLQPLAPGRAEAPRAVLRLRPEPGHIDDLERALTRRAAPRMAQEGADHDVLEDGHVLEGCGHLEGAADAEPRMRFGGRVGDVDAVEDDAPFARPQIAGDAVE